MTEPQTRAGSAALPAAPPAATRPPASATRVLSDELLLTAARLCTFAGERLLTNASSFFFARGPRLFLVTSGHVVRDDASGHHPDRIEIELHTDAANLASSTGFSIPLYQDRRSIWREGRDSGSEIDVAVIEIDRAALPQGTLYRAFTAAHLPGPADRVEIGASLLVVGFPLGFHDTLHHMPVVRHAAVASAFGLRFQGKGYFLTDARTHRGTSGAPVVKRIEPPAPGRAPIVHARNAPPRGAATQDLPWLLLGVHSSRLDVGSRDINLDEALGLNCAWYADILLKLTED
jgi:S1-C subfamily serine protease